MTLNAKLDSCCLKRPSLLAGSKADAVGGLADGGQVEAAAAAKTERTGTNFKHYGNFLMNFGN